MQDPTITLTQEQIDSYHKNGYLSLNAITTPEEVEHIREIYDRLFSEKVGWDQGSQFDLAGTDDEEATLPQLLGPSRFAPELKNTLYKANAEAIAKQLYGDDIPTDRPGEHMIYKPPQIGAPTPWHQDQAYHDPTLLYQGVNFWMTLDDATVDSGCLQYVPGSHKLDVLPHHSINHDPRIHGLEVDNPEDWADKSVACPIPAGGAVFHAAYMLHYAEPNTTDRPRRAYTLAYRKEPTKRETPIDAYWQREKQTARAQRAANQN